MKKFALKSVLFLLLSTLLLPQLVAGGQGEAIDPATLTGEIVYLQGAVMVNDRSVEIGDPVSPGDRIVVGAEGLAEITFGPRNILQFREDTSAIIDPAWGGVELEKGSLAAVLNGLARLGMGDDNRFRVRTATAAMGVRGTAFYIAQPDLNEVYFCTCNGKLHLESVDAEVVEDTEAYHHAAVWYVRTPDGIKSFPSGLHYHDDSTLNGIARKAGTTVRWSD